MVDEVEEWESHWNAALEEQEQLHAERVRKAWLRAMFSGWLTAALIGLALVLS